MSNKIPKPCAKLYCYTPGHNFRCLLEKDHLGPCIAYEPNIKTGEGLKITIEEVSKRTQKEKYNIFDNMWINRNKKG